MKRFINSAIIAVLFFTGCSHVGQMASAEKKEAAAIGHVDKSESARLHKVADYNREIAYALSLPPTPKTLLATNEIVALQYDLTGPAPTDVAKLNKFVDDLSKDDAQAHHELYRATVDNSKLKADFTTAINARNEAVAKSNILASINAGQADKLDHLWDIVYALIALGFVAAILRVLYVFGVFGATVAAKVP